MPINETSRNCIKLPKKQKKYIKSGKLLLPFVSQKNKNKKIAFSSSNQLPKIEVEFWFSFYMEFDIAKCPTKFSQTILQSVNVKFYVLKDS